MRRALLLATLISAFGLGLIVTACSSATDDTAVTSTSTEVTAAATTTTVATTTTTLADPTEAHLFQGEWLLTYTLLEVAEDFDLGIDPGDHDVRVVGVDPTCEVGPCVVEMTFTTPYLPQQGQTLLEAIPVGGVYEVQDSPIIGAGSCAGDDDAFFPEGLDRTTTLSLEPTDFEVIDGTWHVSALTGSRGLQFAPNEEAAAAGCQTFTATYEVSGIPLATADLEMPAAAEAMTGLLIKVDADDARITGPPCDGCFVPEMARVEAEEVGLLLLGTEGADPTRINERPLSNVAWSPDGRSLAYIDLGDIWVTAADGSAERKVLEGARASRSLLAWSPDGTRLAFVRNNQAPREGRDVWYLNLPWGVPERITDGGAALGGVAWGANSSTIYFDWGTNAAVPQANSTRPLYTLESEVWRWDLDDPAAEPAVVNSGLRPAVASDQIVYLQVRTRQGEPTAWWVSVANADGSGSRQLVGPVEMPGCQAPLPNAQQLPCGPSLAPDGSAVAYRLTKSSDTLDNTWDDDGVWVLPLSVGAAVKVYDAGNQPNWSPMGT